MTSNQKGNIALGKAISYFTEHCFTVSIPLNDSQCYDLIIEKEGTFKSVQVKYTSQQADNGRYFCKLQTHNKDTVYYTLKDTFCDFLYCYCENGIEYLIPIEEIESETMLTLMPKYEINKKEIAKIEPVTIGNKEKITVIHQYDLEGNYIASYSSYLEAARAIGKNGRGDGGHIADVCKGIRKTAYGFQWRHE